MREGSNRKQNKTKQKQSDSALSIPAPDWSVVTHGYQNAAVAAEAGLPDGRRAFGEGQCGAPGDQRGDLVVNLSKCSRRFTLSLTVNLQWNSLVKLVMFVLSSLLFDISHVQFEHSGLHVLDDLLEQFKYCTAQQWSFNLRWLLFLQCFHVKL